MWAALAANVPLKVTNDPNRGGGVITVDPTQPTDPVPVETPTPGSTDVPPPTEAAVELPNSIPGTTAADETCSAGNLRANG